jgi:hypothetical protein
MAIEFTTTRFPHHPENVPAELLLGERFVTCDEHKVPTIAIPNGAIFAASTTDPDTWREHEVALETWRENEHVAGVGRVITETETFVGVDFDDIIDPETGELVAWASRLIDSLDSYTEISPSLAGAKVWVKAGEDALTRAYKKPGLEIYPRGRYFTLTGLRLPGARGTVEERAGVLAEVIAAEFPRVDRRRSDEGDYDGPRRALDLGDLLDKSSTIVYEEAHDHDRTARYKYVIRCPWAAEHSHGDTSGTRCGQYESGALWFRCEHAHCGGRDWRAFRHFLESVIYLGRPPRGAGRLR